MNYRRKIEQLGYNVSRGGFFGTCDDRIDRWYLDSIDADIRDRRGPGYATLRDAYEALRCEAWLREEA